MPGVLRSLAKRGGWAGVVGLALGAPAVARPADDPIATSNRLADLPAAPGITPVGGEAPWLAPAPAEPKPMPPGPPAGQALLARIMAPAPAPVAPGQVTWSAPARRAPIITSLPTSDRWMPCEPAIEQASTAPQPAGPPMPPPVPERVKTDQGPNAPRSPEPLPPPALDPIPVPQPTLTATPDADPPPRPITTIRFLDQAPAPKPPAGDADIMAVVRRGGEATGTAADIRAAVERVCKGKVVECQTEVADERQVRVMLTVRAAADWERLYDRMQNLTELGAYGLIFQVRVQKQPG